LATAYANGESGIGEQVNFSMMPSPETALVRQAMKNAQMPRKASTFTQALAKTREFLRRPLENRHTHIRAVISGNNVAKMLSRSAAEKSTRAEDHALAVANLDHLFENALEGWSKRRDNDPSDLKATRRLFAPMETENGTRLVKLTVKESERKEPGNRVYSVETIEVGEESPVPEMVDADRTEGSRLLTGPTGLADSLAQAIRERNRKDKGEGELSSERAAELSRLEETLRRVRGSGQARAVRDEIVGKPLTNLETGIEATVSGESWYKMMSKSNVDLSVSPQAHMQAVGNVDTLFRLATLELERSGKKETDADLISNIRHFIVPMPFDGNVLEVRILAKEFTKKEYGNRLYLVEAVEISGKATPASLVGEAVEGESTESGYSPRPAGVTARFAQMVAAVKGEGASEGASDGLLFQQAAGNRETNAGGTPALRRPANPNSPWEKGKKKVAELTSRKTIDTLLYHAQDKFIDLKRMREQIQEADGTLSDLNDAYEGETLSHARVTKRHKDFLKDELEPLTKDMRQYGVTREAFEKFLHARHATEANAVLAKRNPNEEEIKSGLQEAKDKLRELQEQLQHAQASGSATRGINLAIVQAQNEVNRWEDAKAFRGTEEERLSLSGMSNEEARAVMDDLSPDNRKKMELLAEKVDAINAKTLEILENYGLMSREGLDEWRETYQYYVPLHRDDAHPEGFSHPIGNGFNVRGPAAKQRTGSNEKVTNILGHIAMQREAAITRGEKNRVDKMLFLLASQNPNPGFWTVSQRKKYQPKKKSLDKNGFVRTRIDPNFRNQPNVLMLRIAGKEAYLTFNERNPEAMRLASALKNLDVADMGVLTGLMFKLTRYFASINTQFNPVFGLRNFVRDMGFGLSALSSTELAGQQAQVFGEAMRLLKEATKAGFDLDSMTGDDKALWEELQNTGGTTGYRELYRDPNERTKALDKMLKEVDRGKISKMAYRLGGWISNYNEAMENVVRLAAYKTARDKGLSTSKAASIAKNLTVNFNRRGTATRDMGAWYAFFNASVQGTTRLTEILRSPAGKKILLGGVGLGFVQTLVAMSVMIGSDDDDGKDNYADIPDCGDGDCSHCGDNSGNDSNDSDCSDCSGW
jgi:hypothetical protein